MCSHEDTIDDVRNGCEVCLQCGQVTSNLMLPHKSEDIPASSTMTFDNEFQIRNELLDLCSALYIDGGFIVDQAITNLHRYSKDQEMGNLLRINISKHSDRCLLAYVLWETFNQNNVPRSPHEIAYFFNLPVHDIMRAEKTLNIASTFCVPSTYVHRLCAEIELNFRLTLIIEKIIQSSLDHCMHRPETIIGGIILAMKNAVLKKKIPVQKKCVTFDDKFTNDDTDIDEINLMNTVKHQILGKKFDETITQCLKKISAKTLAEKFHVSEASMYSFRSKLDVHCLNIMYMNIVLL